mgnify:CR=1 FL=1
MPTKIKKQTKTDTILAMLKEPKGVTITRIAEVTGWEIHTVRGALANLKKSRNLDITSKRIENERRYFLQETPAEAK